MTKVVIEDNYKEKKQVPKCIIYLNAEKTSFRTIQPMPGFGGDWSGLVQHITNSDLSRDVKNYHSFVTL